MFRKLADWLVAMRYSLREIGQLKDRVATLESRFSSLGEPSAANAGPSGTSNQVSELTAKVGLLEVQIGVEKYWTLLARQQARALARELWGEPAPCIPPPRSIPTELRNVYTMDGRIPVEDWYQDMVRPSNYPPIYNDEQIDDYLARIQRREQLIYGLTDEWLYQAIEKYPISGMVGAVLGSLSPWYEAICIHYGAQPTTIDYNRIISRSSRLRTLTVEQYESEPQTFDFAVSISSFEHDGLGKYGDPLDPDGDLKAMQKMKSVVRRGGLMFFAVPVGLDMICFNDFRVYGRVRLPLLLKGWSVAHTFGMRDQLLDVRCAAQPIFVLRND